MDETLEVQRRKAPHPARARGLFHYMLRQVIIGDPGLLMTTVPAITASDACLFTTPLSPSLTPLPCLVPE